MLDAVTTVTSLHGRSMAAVVDRLAAVPGREGRLTHLERLPARPGRTAPWPEWAAPSVVEAFRGRGIDQPWRHQAAAAEAAYAGQHVVLSTGTASGKSMAYQLPALTAALEGRGLRGERGATTLYLAPTKALAQDQLAGLTELGLDVRITTHDGDSGRDQREWARDHAEYILTNPDMLHRSLLPGHERWRSFLSQLSFVVIDECHHYRGVFGAHVAQVLRRLRRICAAYGAQPTFVLASATVAEAEAAAARLTGLDVLAVTGDASPRGEQSPLTASTSRPVSRAAAISGSATVADASTNVGLAP